MITQVGPDARHVGNTTRSLSSRCTVWNSVTSHSFERSKQLTRHTVLLQRSPCCVSPGNLPAQLFNSASLPACKTHVSLLLIHCHWTTPRAAVLSDVHSPAAPCIAGSPWPTMPRLNKLVLQPTGIIQAVITPHWCSFKLVLLVLADGPNKGAAWYKGMFPVDGKAGQRFQFVPPGVADAVSKALKEIKVENTFSYKPFSL